MIDRGLAWVVPTTPVDRVVIAKETEQPCLGQELGAGQSLEIRTMDLGQEEQAQEDEIVYL